MARWTWPSICPQEGRSGAEMGTAGTEAGAGGATAALGNTEGSGRRTAKPPGDGLGRIQSEGGSRSPGTTRGQRASPSRWRRGCRVWSLRIPRENQGMSVVVAVIVVVAAVVGWERMVTTDSSTVPQWRAGRGPAGGRGAGRCGGAGG